MIQHINMMIIQITMTLHRREEYQHGATECYMKNLRNVEEVNLNWCIMEGKNLSSLTIDQFMPFSNLKFVSLIKQRNKKSKRNCLTNCFHQINKLPSKIEIHQIRILSKWQVNQKIAIQVNCKEGNPMDLLTSLTY